MSSRTTFCDPPQELKDRAKELGERLATEDKSLGLGDAELLLHVELGFALMERLCLNDEPVTAVWAVLSGTPIRHPRLNDLPAELRRAIANARQIVPYSSRFSWRNALTRYIRLPRHYRHYDFTVEEMEDRIIETTKDAQPRHRQHENFYEQCLTELLPFHERQAGQDVKAAKDYQFSAKTEGRAPIPVSVRFTEQQLNLCRAIAQPFCTQRPRHSSASFSMSALEEMAARLDVREEELRHLYGSSIRPGDWEKRLGKLHYRLVLADGTLASEDADKIEVCGFSHVGGMVASGKSTVAALAAALTVYEHLKANEHSKQPSSRLTIVVGDTQSAIKLANQINWWFLDDPETHIPVAVPLLGRRSRDKHLRELHAARDYEEHQRRNQPHWGERWLGTACALQGLIPPDALLRHLDGRMITPGQEPCESLKEAPQPGRSRERKDKGKSHPCPFFNVCPSQQLWRDMPLAPVWITTPGALALGRLPQQIERRPIHMGELVYEQSDLVIFDEAETIMEWFDQVYAEEVWLTNGKNGVFDRLGLGTEAFSLGDRTPDAGTQRWNGAQRGTQTAITATLALFNYPLLAKWVSRGYFTPNTLFYKFARRCAGLEDFDAPGVTEEERHENEKTIQSFLRPFDILFNGETDPLRARLKKQNTPAYALYRLLEQISVVGESATDERIHQQCIDWITLSSSNVARHQEAKKATRVARLEEKLEGTKNKQEKANLRKRHEKREEYDPVDTLPMLAVRLQFALTVALLDRHTRIVFYEWQNRPPSIEEDQQPHRRMPPALLDVLPLPPTGRQFGTYYRRSNVDDDTGVKQRDANTLSVFAYTNIGRWYVLNFHRLLSDLDGRPGPHVLALSGTSFLPDSTRFHVGDPRAILLPERAANEAISESRFMFLPQRETDDLTPIRLSGRLQWEEVPLVQQIAQTLIHENGPVQKTLDDLRRLGTDEPERWRDRERILILVNSYRQAKLAAVAMDQTCPSSLRDRIYCLARVEGSGTSDIEAVVSSTSGATPRGTKPGELRRSDIETFARGNGKILIAPMSAIGRGYNILNEHDKAAFGAVYFLTRPYPHPDDTPALAQEVNRRALDWVNDADFAAWQSGDGVLGRAEEVRRLATRYWRMAEQRSHYKTLRSDSELGAYPRLDLAATTAGLVIQAVGRLLRGGVPFHAFFVDAAWAPKNSTNIPGSEDEPNYDTPSTSLLAAMVELIGEYAAHPIGKALYKPLADALACMEDEGFCWRPDAKIEYKD